MRKNLTEIVFILDRSGSMNGLERDTIGGFNSMIEQQKKAEGEALISTMLFDNVSSAFEVVQIVVSALIGLFGVAAALNGFVYKKIPMLFRLAMAAGGLCMMIPGTASDVVGLVMVGGIVLIQRMSVRRLAA